MSKVKLKIGEFSKMMQVTVKTLRHYEEMGILTPSEVDEWTGYRYYQIVQMQRLNSIRKLKSLGFTLEEIKDLFDEEQHTPTIRQLDEKIRECNAELLALLERRQQLLDLRDFRKNLNNMDGITIQSLPEIIVASHREVLKSYSDIKTICVEKIGPEIQRLGCKSSVKDFCFTMCYGNEYTPIGIDVEFCKPVEEKLPDSDIIKFRTIPAVEKAVCIKAVGPYDHIYNTYIEAFKYIEEKGLEIAGLARNVFVDGVWNHDDPEKWVSIIQIPVK